jgi:predicted nucleotidyltransferase
MANMQLKCQNGDVRMVSMMHISLKDSYKGNLPWLVNNTIFATLHGSHAYGTNTPASDVDVKGFCVPPKQYFLGYTSKFEQAEAKDPDMVIYDIRKFFELASNCNPNIIEVLHTDPSDWIMCSKLGQKVIDNKDLFISMRARYTFSGYAFAQLKRINTHYRWLKTPPKAPPTRAEFGLPESTMVPADQLGAAEAEIKKKIEEWDINWDLLEPADRINMQGKISTMLAESKLTTDETYIVAARSLGFNDNFIDYLKKERSYKTKKQDWDSYQSWLKTRNEKRAELERKYGYDTKHGAHLVRLMRMCREIMTTGKVVVKRPDAQELLGIRNGDWTYEKLIEWAAKEEAELNAIYEEQSKSQNKIIPYSPDRTKLDSLCQEIVEEALYGSA